MKPLTPRQKRILDLMKSYRREHGYMPSYREVGMLVGLSSPATVHQYIRALKEKGYVVGPARASRALELVDDVIDIARAHVLPLVGTITAGEPIEALQEHETMAVPAQLVMDPVNTYVLRVKGRSMIEDGIFDGDYVIVERNPSPKDGDVVVALLDNAYATLKRFYREAHRIRLQPANVTMEPIFVEDPIIQGVVRAVIRQFSAV